MNIYFLPTLTGFGQPPIYCLTYDMTTSEGTHHLNPAWPSQERVEAGSQGSDSIPMVSKTAPSPSDRDLRSPAMCVCVFPSCCFPTWVFHATLAEEGRQFW